MKLFKKLFSIIMAGAFVLGTSVFSTSSSDKEKYEVENTSLISNEMGGGGYSFNR